MDNDSFYLALDNAVTQAVQSMPSITPQQSAILDEVHNLLWQWRNSQGE